MAEVRFDNVTRRYGDVFALRELNLEVQDEEFMALVGPSGSGKSTALRLLAGLEAISSGDIFIGGRRVNDVAARDRDIAMVFQSYALYPHMSVYDNIAFSLKLRKASRTETKDQVVRAARILGIEDLLKRKPRQLSGGQRQRVALGRAIVRDPAVFLLDEPLSNLDAKLRVQTRAEITKLHQRLRTTFVYVTHDQVEAMTMADRIAVLDHGVLQQVGAPRELYERPANVFVAGFIGSPAMNLFEVALAGDGDEMRLEREGLTLALPARISSAMATLKSRRLVAGIRPENIHDPHFEPPETEQSALRGRVDVVEMLGNETLVHLAAGETTLLARVDPRTQVTAGEDAVFAVDMSRLHLFDPETRLAIRTEA